MAAYFGTNPPDLVVQQCPLPQESTKPTYWIEIELFGEDDQPIPWEEYRLVLPSKEIVRGYVDETGWARVDDIKNPGTCQVTFPRLDKDAWLAIATLPPRPSAAD